MGYFDELSNRYGRYIALPWRENISGAERTVFVVYDKTNERQLRTRLGLFELATTKSKHKWRLCDVTRTFGEWMSSLEYRESYFEDPEDLHTALEGDFPDFVAGRILQVLSAADTNTAVGVVGIGSLYGFVHVSKILHRIEQKIPGRLVVFFPGSYDKNNYRLLDARDGWDYLAVPITMGDYY